jgi:hypothetical protein
MAPRPRKTLIDYLVVAISPALIMLLIGSLVLFLLEVFYQGNFQGRLQYIFSLFVFAAVLVARIAIEEGRERAILFALPLAVVTLVAIERFVQFQGGILTHVNFFINCAIIALILWSADRLTWDCTVIDESELDSGEGLLEAVGFDRPDFAALQQQINPRAAEAEANRPKEEPKTWWQRYVEQRRRPHTPGVWVVYFSLAALPLFALGQIFLPRCGRVDRQYAFGLLAVYTASGLGLLLATSFLGLRRYLRQRRQEMPALMVNLWLGIGAALIVGVMLIALFLPRPNAEYAVSELPFRIGSPDQDASPYGSGEEGVEQNQPDAQPGQAEGEPAGTAQSDQSGGSQSGEQKGNSSDDNSAADSKQPGEQSQTDNSQNQSASGNNQPHRPERHSRNQGHPEQGHSDQGHPERSEGSPSPSKNADHSQSRDEREKEKPSGEQPNSKKQPTGSSSAGGAQPPKESSKGGGSRGAGTTPRAPSMPRPISPPHVSWLPILLKWIFYGFLLWLAWRYRRELLEMLRTAWQQFLELWHNLFGGWSRRKKVEVVEAVVKKPSRRFADFTDPFAAGVAERYPPGEIVRYTFEALEAWANDHGCPRQPDQTPHEFTRSLAVQISALKDPTRRLADLYCQVAYAPDTLPIHRVRRLSHLWQALRAQAAVTAPVSSG